MKSIKRFAYVFAAAIVGLAMASCNNNEPDPTTAIDGARETVKTQFSIAMPKTIKTGARRMPGTTVQDDGTFRGMKEIKLLPYTVADTTKAIPVQGTEAMVGSYFGLTAIDALAETNNSKVYEDIQIPVGVNAFLLYGQANDAPADDAGYQTFGWLEPAGLDDVSAVTLANVNFTLKPIYAPAEGTTGPAEATAIADYLTAIAQAKDADNNAWATTTDVKLGTLYTTFTGLTAGSSASVLETVKNLYKLVASYKGANTAIAEAIKTAIATKATVTGEGESAAVTALDATLQDYPSKYYLPDGAALVKFADGAFAAVTDKNVLAEANHTALQNYAYPASLYYFVNSALRGSDAKQSDNFAGKTWADIIDLYTYGTVKATTRSIILKSTVEYAVARLDVNVKANAESLKDAVDSTLAITGMTVNSVLVGVKNSTADWKFEPVASTTPVTVYDKFAADATLGIVYANAPMNYTLMLENAADEVVTIAIELTNGGDKAFVGMNNQIIPAGGKFYLCGQLTPESGKKVFEKDHKTVVSMNIKDLTKAYNVIPDLQVPELELGLSVDLVWQEGLSFQIDL